jgi:hypothetical protein
MKDFSRRGKPVAVTDWHVRTLGRLCWHRAERWDFGASGLCHGANRDRIEVDTIIAFDR